MSLNDLITRVEKHNIIPDLYNEGISYDELKKTVIDTLKPYFTNKANLKLTPIDIYLDSWIHFIKLQSKDEYFNIFKKILDFYNKSKSFEQNETFMIISSWSTDYDSGQSTLWSLLNSENILDTFENKEDYLNYVLQMLGSIIEGVTKPILKELYQLNKFLCSESISKDEINNLDLGVLVESLDNIAEFNNFFKPLPKRLKISQWRKILHIITRLFTRMASLNVPMVREEIEEILQQI